jgi:hypothetical protein
VLNYAFRLLADFHWNRMKIAGKSKADLGFHRNRPFVAGTRNSEPVLQRRKSIFPFGGRQRSEAVIGSIYVGDL